MKSLNTQKSDKSNFPAQINGNNLRLQVNFFCLNERIQVTFMQMNINSFLTCQKKWKMCNFCTSLSIHPVVTSP